MNKHEIVEKHQQAMKKLTEEFHRSDLTSLVWDSNEKINPDDLPWHHLAYEFITPLIRLTDEDQLNQGAIDILNKSRESEKPVVIFSEQPIRQREEIQSKIEALNISQVVFYCLSESETTQ